MLDGIELTAPHKVIQSSALPLLIAQRGNAAEFPENTLPALRSALELGIKHIEFDVQLTADCIPVVADSRSLARTANLQRSVLDLLAAELHDVRVSEPGRFGQRFADVGIPTLVQAAELLAHFPHATAFVDIQSESLQHFGCETVIRRVCENLRATSKQVVLIAESLPAVEYIRRNSDFRNGWILPDYSQLSALKSEAVAPDFLFCDVHLLPNDNHRLWRGPWKWAIGEITSYVQGLSLATRGASYIQTSEARSLLRELRRYRKSID
jgi:glycerophosphoryl diester phosphodiesterase